MEEYTTEQLKYFNDEELIAILKKSWGIPEDKAFEVYGELKAKYNSTKDTYHYRIINLFTKNKYSIEYPISDLSARQSIRNNGIYVSTALDKKYKEFARDGLKVKVSCELVLSSPVERTKSQLPCLVNAIAGSVELLDTISDEYIVLSEEQKTLIKESIVLRHIKENKKIIDDSIKTFENERDAIKAKVEGLSEEHENLIKNINTLNDAVLEKEILKESLLNELNTLKIELTKDKELMAKNLEKFRNFIQEKADQLLKLEFISNEEYDELLSIKKSDQHVNEGWIDFHEELNGDFAEAVSHIQAYLFKNDIVYPRYIIEDFFALIQTNDLIILAGESGSGKTNLVKSFAKAVGGKAFIIPVKPNWTSTEDLLGYYNPLEKKYLSTPFLEALIEAKKNPDTPYFICLDEMNLARVEYYFADFLSLLEERNEIPELKLYSDDESAHILSEFKNVIHLIDQSKEKYQKHNLVDFVSMLQDDEINNELKRVFGFSDKDSLIKYHSDLRRMIGGIINTPSSITFPKNVRIIGAINIDETTYYLSPKILDRAHIMKFESPLLYEWDNIKNEIEKERKSYTHPEYKLRFNIEDFGVRTAYPSFSHENKFCKIIIEFSKKYFSKLGIEVGLRTIRQGLHYQEIFLKFNDDNELSINNFIVHKIFPKMVFDGNMKVNGIEKVDILREFHNELKIVIGKEIANMEGRSFNNEFEILLNKAKENDNIVNYWA